jgi:cell division protein FtsL
MMQDQKPIQPNSFALSGLFAFVLVCVLAALIGITILLTHHIRHLETAVFNATEAKAELDEEWGRLMLEKGHLTSPGRVEVIARDSLNMHEAKPDVILILPNSSEDMQ